LDRRPIDRTLQAYMSAPQYVDPPEEPKTIEIGDYVTVTMGDLIGKSGLVLWASGEFIWLHDDADLQRSDDHATPFLRVQASMVERTRLPATIKFTKERGYDIRPGDAVSVARGPEFRTKGVVSAVDFLKAQLTLETDGDHSFVSFIEFSLLNLSNCLQITVPIRFVMKTRNVDLDDFKKFIGKEVYIIGGEKKGFRATLYGLSPDDCVVAVHGQPRMIAKRYDIATRYVFYLIITSTNIKIVHSFGCRLNGAMLEWGEFTSFCEMRRKSHVAPPLRSITPPPERLAPVEPGPSTSWTSWSSEAVASAGPQINTESSTEDPWVVNPSDNLPVPEPIAVNPRGQ
jgi:ribosomal protein L24